MTERLVLAVDGGNSKTAAALAGEDASLHAYVRGGGSSPHRLGVAGSMRLLDDLVGRVWRQAGYGSDAAADRAEIYLAGADLPTEVADLRLAVGEHAWAPEWMVGNDAVALLRTGTDDADAVAVVCGAGINCVGRAADGRVATFPSLGQITGDWGGGRHLGHEALWHAARSEDGRGPRTLLESMVTARFDRLSVADVGAGLHLGEIHEGRVDELAPTLFTAAAAGDRVANELVQRLADELAVLATASLARLDLTEAAVPVVLGGGVVRAQADVLVPLVREHLAADAPSAWITVVSDPPVLGAALYGLDTLGADDEAKKRLHEQLRQAHAEI